MCWCKHAAVKAKDEDAIHSFVGHSDISPTSVKRIEMRFGKGLLSLVRARLSFQLHRLDDRSDRTVFHQRHDLECAPITGAKVV
jgi:hypothetical protein